MSAAVWVDEVATWQLDGHRVDREVTTRQVDIDDVTETHYRLARIAGVRLGPMGGDFKVSSTGSKANRAELLALCPQVLGERSHDPFDLGRQGIGCQINVTACDEWFVKPLIAHYAADEKEAIPRVGKQPAEFLDLVQHIVEIGERHRRFAKWVTAMSTISTPRPPLVTRSVSKC